MLLVVFGAVTLSTLPFTPTASAWNGLNGSWDIFTIFYWLAFVLLFVGFIKHGGRKEESIQGHERWIHVIYPLGLIFMLVTHWFCGIWGWPGSFTVGSMWFSLPPSLALVAFFAFRRFRKTPIVPEGSLKWYEAFVHKIGMPVARFLSLDWVNGLFKGLFGLLQKVVMFLSEILEGQGGVMWAFLLLVVLISLAISKGTF